MDDPAVWDSLYFQKQGEENTSNVFWRRWRSEVERWLKSEGLWALAKLRRIVRCDDKYFQKHTGNVFIFIAIFSLQTFYPTVVQSILFYLSTSFPCGGNLWRRLVCFDLLPGFSAEKLQIFTLITWKKKKTLILNQTATHNTRKIIPRKQIKEKHNCLVSQMLVSSHWFTAAHCVQTSAISAVKVLYFLLKTQSPFPIKHQLLQCK